MPTESAPTVFKTPLNANYFQWQHIPPLERMHWNYLLRRVVKLDSDAAQGNDIIDHRQFTDANDNPRVVDGCTNFYNQDFCLALTVCPDEQTERIKDELIVVTPTDGKSREDIESTSPLPLRDTTLRGLPPLACLDFDTSSASVEALYPYLTRPHFNYHRKSFDLIKVTGTNPGTVLQAGYSLQSLTIGSLVWLYFYERMGIFKILGVLLDDYNYRGKYSLSSQIRGDRLKNKNYVDLLEHLSFLTRQGVASTFRDRLSTYQRVLGVTIQNDLNVQSAENSPFMKNFSKLIANMLEYYNAKRLSVAIQNNTTQVRSSVATQTAILNTVKVLSQNFEVMEYGRNMIHTFLGISTVYVTLSLIKQIRDVIGIPREYDTPEEYVPAAYDILVLKKQGAPADSNRYTVFDSCASYGYRLLTDVQSANLSSFTLGDLNSPFDAWLSSVEEWVEGYNNAFKSIPDKTTSEIAVAAA